MSSGQPGPAPRFIADHNVGKLGRWLRMMGFDTESFGEGEDWRMVARAVAEDRALLTRDTDILKRRLVTDGKLKAILLKSTQVEQQLRQVVDELGLAGEARPLTRCLECNQPLVETTGEAVADRVPAYVRKTASEYRECPACHRVYWKGTHWQAMSRRIKRLMETG